MSAGGRQGNAGCSEEPIVSIVVPSYNKGPFIEETIRSVLSQSYANIELIIIDGGSQDQTHAILEKYRHAVSRCVIESDEGQSDAINKGISMAKGEIVGWLNADDLLYRDGIRAIVDAFGSDPSIGVVYGAGAKIDIRGNEIKPIDYRAFDPQLLRQLFYILQPCMYFKKDLFLRVGGLNKGSYYAMDWELALKMLRIAKFKSIPQKIAKLRMYEGTKTSGGGWESYREIACIGRRMNGIRDVNYIAYHLRSLVAAIEWPGIDRVLRSGVEKICDRLAGGDLYMVCRWPEAFQRQNCEQSDGGKSGY